MIERLIFVRYYEIKIPENHSEIEKKICEITRSGKSSIRPNNSTSLQHYNYFHLFSGTSHLNLMIQKERNSKVLIGKASLSFSQILLLLIPLLLSLMHLLFSSHNNFEDWTFDFFVLLFVPIYYLYYQIMFWFGSAFCFNALESIIIEIIEKENQVG